MSVKCRVLEGGLCEITQGYKAGVHNGIDLVGKDYTLAWEIAHSDGTVVAVRNNCNGFENGSYGNYVKIRHDNGYYTLYAHGAYNTVKVSVGQRVSRGQRLMYMGNTGYSFGGHLHWEVRTPNDVKIDPTPYLDADLPSSSGSTGKITYQAYTNRWLPEVSKVDNTENGYAGVYGESITGFRCKPQYGTITYEAHLLGGDWIGAVSSSDYSSGGGNSYAGIYGRPIDGIRIKSSQGWVKYRVHIKGGDWLPWAEGFGDSGNLFAGIYGKEIDGIQMY